MEHSFKFFMNASLIILANIHNQCSFSFLFFLFKTPFLSTTKSCMCMKSDTKQKPPPYSTELGLHDGISVNTQYPVRVKLQSPQPQPWPATTIPRPPVPFLHFRATCSENSHWLGLCLLFPDYPFPVPQEAKCSLLIGCLELQYLSIGGNLVFCLCKKVPLLLLMRVRGQHLLNHS